MSDQLVYRITIGEFKCLALNDGFHDYAPAGFFADVPEDKVAAGLAARGLPVDTIRTPFTSVFVNTGTERVLIDTGAGNFIPTAGKLRSALSTDGTRPEDVDVVLLTHAHADHIGGVLDENGAPIYSNATHIMPLTEHDYWRSSEAREGEPPRFFELANQLFDAVAGRLRLIESDETILPGISAIPAPGHTRGHIAVSITSGDDELMYISDTVFHPLHLQHPEWMPGGPYLNDAEQYRDSVRQVCGRAADSGCLVLAMHFDPFPSLGHIEADGTAWRWRSLE